MEQIKKYFKSKTGMITVGVLATLIILCIVLLVSCPKDSEKAGQNDKGKNPGNTVENMEDADMTVSDDTDGPKIEDGSTDFSDTEEEEDIDGSGNSDQKDEDKNDNKQDDDKQDDDKKDDGADIEDPTPGQQWGPLF